MQTIIDVIIPIFSIILCGLIAGKFELIRESGVKALNFYVYYFALPALLFFSLAGATKQEITSISFIMVNVLSLILCFVLAIIVFLVLFKKSFSEGLIYAMASSYGNTGFLGIPLVIAAFGQEAAVPAAIINFTYDLILITIVVVSFELNRLFKKNEKASLVKPVMEAVLLNPINASLLAGCSVAVLQIPVPTAINVFTDTLGAAAGPTALFALGLGLSWSNTGHQNGISGIKEYTTFMSIKLAIQPIITWWLVTFVFELNDLWAMTAMLLSALPTGAIVNVMADKYHTLVDRVPKMIVLSTIISVFTLSIFIVFIT
ncbi:putative permease [Salibacterium salarium]|uniref:AEC family transporter n=1 Tax=Salibacterium salarium TaxID=284579 RepID=UPI00277E67F8|nr:AEC family transporter [Salibacterium salarium]MDQ0298035.1 putative permease [Salibacterium salarium]